jgi:hypothetical protein
LISVPLSFGWLQENTRLCHGRRRVWRPKKLARFFRLYFVITRDSLYISTIYCSLL